MITVVVWSAPMLFPTSWGVRGNIHPDTRTDNGTFRMRIGRRAIRTPTNGSRSSFAQAGMPTTECNGCAEGQRDLAFTYGFLTHAGEDMWGHTFVNGFARGVFPDVTEISGDPADWGSRSGTRHGGLRRCSHSATNRRSMRRPASSTTRSSTIRRLQRSAGALIDKFFKLRATLEKKRANVTDYIDHGTFTGCGWPVNWPACAGGVI